MGAESVRCCWIVVNKRGEERNSPFPILWRPYAGARLLAVHLYQAQQAYSIAAFVSCYVDDISLVAGERECCAGVKLLNTNQLLRRSTSNEALMRYGGCLGRVGVGRKQFWRFLSCPVCLRWPIPTASDPHLFASYPRHLRSVPAFCIHALGLQHGSFVIGLLTPPREIYRRQQRALQARTCARLDVAIVLKFLCLASPYRVYPFWFSCGAYAYSASCITETRPWPLAGIPTSPSLDRRAVTAPTTVAVDSPAFGPGVLRLCSSLLCLVAFAGMWLSFDAVLVDAVMPLLGGGASEAQHRRVTVHVPPSPPSARAPQEFPY